MVEAVGAATPVRVDRQSLALRTRQQKAYLRSRDAQRIVFDCVEIKFRAPHVCPRRCVCAMA